MERQNSENYHSSGTLLEHCDSGKSYDALRAFKKGIFNLVTIGVAAAASFFVGHYHGRTALIRELNVDQEVNKEFIQRYKPLLSGPEFNETHYREINSAFVFGEVLEHPVTDTKENLQRISEEGKQVRTTLEQRVR